MSHVQSSAVPAVLDALLSDPAVPDPRGSAGAALGPAVCRNLGITLMHCTACTEIGADRRSFAYHPAQALALVLPTTRRT